MTCYESCRGDYSTDLLLYSTTADHPEWFTYILKKDVGIVFKKPQADSLQMQLSVVRSNRYFPLVTGNESCVIPETSVCSDEHYPSIHRCTNEGPDFQVSVGRCTCWLGGVAWEACPVGGACPPLLSTTGMLGDVVLRWGLNESCQSTAFLFNTHTLLIPPLPFYRGKEKQVHR